MTAREATIRRLRAERPRSRFLRASGWAVVGLVAVSWALGGFLAEPAWSAGRAANLRRLLHEVVPYPLQGADWSWSVAATWLGGIWRDYLGEATFSTLATSVAAILLAGSLGAFLVPWAARGFACPEPFLTDPVAPRWPVRLAWGAVVVVARALLTLLRSIPEYVWAFLLIALYGPTAWPLVLALALHNAGILGKLTADLVEHLEQPTLAALRGLGARRRQIVFAGIFPLSVNRFLLYLFYRWETCVREATVLGMLGLASLGFWIQDARARNHYDEMVLVMAAGGLLVTAGDLVSALARELVRRT
ncbi:MAG TPA: ABC transporter permease subunit [Candidatus Krumholzibacteria bacterium]|nr:ABC transporter permease subunit [Candidatus Krumholzibacteria bacterium]HPD72537.1 ABC transporter permease subunit [Candidatus Krumholzibacteria bacterium]HRY40531.1 ABC transporter permease subunit [Candidatus Krumholzibacteria bacterium]